MCGLFGWSFKKRSHVPDGKREVLASTLAVANSMRGDHSWGMFATERDGRSKVIHKVGDIAKVPGFAAWGRASMVMAHTRFATVGKISVKNAHPFKVGNILLSHNGAVYNHDEMGKKYSREYEVDSEHLAMHLNEGKDTSELEGYGAIVWSDDRDPGRIYICRMLSGSMSVFGIKASSGEQVGVAWSSDESHIKNALGAARLDCFPYEKGEEGKVFFTQNGDYFIAKCDPIKLKETSYQSRWSYKSAYQSDYNDSMGDFGWSGGHMGRNGAYSYTRKCKKCNHFGHLGRVCPLINCSCNDDVWEATDTRLTVIDGSKKTGPDTADGTRSLDALRADKIMSKSGYWKCYTCDHWHDQNTRDKSCVRIGCLCIETESDRAIIVSGTEKAAVQKFESIFGTLTPMDVGCWITQAGEVLDIDEIHEALKWIRKTDTTQEAAK